MGYVIHAKLEEAEFEEMDMLSLASTCREWQSHGGHGERPPAIADALMSRWKKQPGNKKVNNGTKAQQLGSSKAEEQSLSDGTL